MRHFILFCSFLFCISIAQGQIVDEPNLDFNSYGTKKFDKAQKRIYIKEFNVSYQVLYSQKDKQASNLRGRVFTAGSDVELAVAVTNVTDEQLQRITDKVYEEYLTQLKADGYTIISGKDAASIDAFNGWELVKGGTVTRAEVDGYVTTNPSTLDFYVKGIKQSGERKEKFFDNTPFISDQLEDAIIAKVEIFVPFAEDGESSFSRSMGRMTTESKTVIQPYFRVGSPSVTAEPSGITSLVKNFGETGSFVEVSFTSGKTGAGANAYHQTTLKKPIDINDVFDDKKIKSYARGGTDVNGTTYGAIRAYSAETESIKNLKIAECDAQKYEQGAYQACSKLVDNAVKDFLKKAK